MRKTNKARNLFTEIPLAVNHWPGSFCIPPGSGVKTQLVLRSQQIKRAAWWVKVHNGPLFFKVQSNPREKKLHAFRGRVCDRPGILPLKGQATPPPGGLNLERRHLLDTEHTTKHTQKTGSRHKEKYFFPNKYDTRCLFTQTCAKDSFLWLLWQPWDNLFHPHNFVQSPSQFKVQNIL